MYLSKVLLTGGRAGNPYEVHRQLWRAFPDAQDRTRDFLFRAEWGRRRTTLPVLLQSLTEPRSSSDAGVEVLATKAFEPRLREGQVLRFALAANPTKRLSEARKRVPYVKHEEQVAWLRRKLAGAAEVLDADVVGQEALHFRKGGLPGKVVVMTFSGYLRTVEPDRLRSVMVSGIGPAKSFGCGLLTVARA